MPHADSDLVELMKKLVRRKESSSEHTKSGRYDPDERILARQALKDGCRGVQAQNRRPGALSLDRTLTFESSEKQRRTV